jgi:hypothetical protein
LKQTLYHVDGFFQNAVPANQTNVRLARHGGAAPAVWIAPRNGWVHDIWVFSDAARTTGTLTLTLFKNGVALGATTAVLNAVNTTYKLTQVDNFVLPFNPGDQLDLRVTTATWAPTTANILAGMEVEV